MRRKLMMIALLVTSTCTLCAQIGCSRGPEVVTADKAPAAAQSVEAVTAFNGNKPAGNTPHTVTPSAN